MVEIINITLENEMDLVLAHKRSMKLAENLGLTIATQTAFATAVSDVARTVIDHTNRGILHLGIEGKNQKYGLAAEIKFDTDAEISKDNEGLFYAKKLVSEFNFETTNNICNIQMSIGIPRSFKIDNLKILQLRDYFVKEEPLNAYEAIKKKNNFLNKITTEQEEEIRQEKLINEKKNEFISIASHEIKTPITVLKAYTQMLRTYKDTLDPGMYTIIEKLNLQTTKLATLVQQLLDVSQMENGTLLYNKEQISVNQFIEDVVSVLSVVHNGHKINITHSEDVTLNIDKLRMEQVFTNLVGNAAKYSESETEIQLICSVKDNDFTVSVQDQGLGMSAESLASIFQKFYRNKEVIGTHPGLGMGLYITSKIVVDHGGKIWAESEPGEGSTFHISFPYLKDY